MGWEGKVRVLLGSTKGPWWSSLQEAWEPVQFLTGASINLEPTLCGMLDVETIGDGKRSNSPQRFLMSRKLSLPEAAGKNHGNMMTQRVLEKTSLPSGTVVSMDDELYPGTSPVIIISSISQL